MPKQTRRAPAPEDRRQDAERSRAALLLAARREFADKGYAGARVADIAARAGLNKQLISYYFGGKSGLYEELRMQWLVEEDRFADRSLTLADLTVRYLETALDDPSWARLALWDALASDGEHRVPHDAEDMSDLERRQAEGELAGELDPAAVLLMITGAVAAPIALPSEVVRIMGLDPQSPEFRERYADQLRLVIRRLAEAGHQAPASPA